MLIIAVIIISTVKITINIFIFIINFAITVFPLLLACLPFPDE